MGGLPQPFGTRAAARPAQPPPPSCTRRCRRTGGRAARWTAPATPQTRRAAGPPPRRTRRRARSGPRATPRRRLAWRGVRLRRRWGRPQLRRLRRQSRAQRRRRQRRQTHSPQQLEARPLAQQKFQPCASFLPSDVHALKPRSVPERSFPLPRVNPSEVKFFGDNPTSKFPYLPPPPAVS